MVFREYTIIVISTLIFNPCLILQAKGVFSKEQDRFSTGKANFIQLPLVMDVFNGFYDQEKDQIEIEVFFLLRDEKIIFDYDLK